MSMRGNPLSAKEILDACFLEHRARILEIAAFLDRLDRAEGGAAIRSDFRYRALARAVQLLLKPEAGRTKAIQLSFSDLSAEPVESAAGMKGALGAWEGAFSEDH